MNELSTNQAAVLRQAIEALEAQRGKIDDATLETTLAALRAQLAQLETSLQQSDNGVTPRLMTCLVANLVTRDKDATHGLKIMDYGFNLVAEIARLYSGTVQGVRGNYLVALFSGGADDPIRAAHASLEMRERMVDYATELEQGGQGTVTFRAGLNIGMFAPGGTTPKGEASMVDIAGVLSQYAPPGSILVSQQLHAYLIGKFNLQVAPSVEVARKRITVYRLIEAQEAALSPRRMVSLDTPFLGRAEEMKMILKRIERLGSGQGGVVVIAGESGLGKSRLVAEVRRAASVIQWIDARCQVAPVKLIYGAWNQLLFGLINTQPMKPLRDIDKNLHDWLNERNIAADCYPFLANQIGIAPLDDSIPERVARQTLEAWQIALSALIHQRPTAIIFEEAQAMDSASLALFEALVDSLQDYPVLWILVTQPLYNQPAATVLTRLSRRLGERYTYIGLEPINDEESQALLHAVLGGQVLPDPLQTGILERATGNPLFLQQIVRTLIDRRGLVLDPQGRWSATAAALQDHMPTSLREVIIQRVRNLPGDAQELLQLIAVAGDALLPGVLRAMTSPANTAGLLDLLREAGLIGAETEICHPALREIIYQEISKQKRAAMHRQVAAALLDACELSGPWLAVRAYHMDKGQQVQSALGAYEAAKAWAYGNNALTEASDIIGAMLDLMNERDMPEQVASLLVEQQDVLFQLDPEDSRCSILLEHAFELWSNVGDPAEAASVLIRMAMHHTGTPQEDGHYRDAQSLLERENQRHPMLPNVYLRRALYAAQQGVNGQGAHSSFEFFERARALALELKDVETLAQIHFEMGLYLRNNHQLTEALSAFQQAMAYFSQLKQAPPDEPILTCNYLADLYYHLGRPGDGEYYAMEAVNESARGSDIIQVLPYITLSECYAAQGRWHEAIQAINEAPAHLAPPELPPQFWLGRWQFESGDTLSGLETMRESLPTQNLECMMLFIDYLLEADFAEEASLRLHQMVKQGRFNDPNSTVPTQAYYDRLRGRLAVASKDFGRAVGLLDRAMRQFERESFELLTISTSRVYALALIGRCGPGDEEIARTMLNKCATRCKSLSIHAEAHRIQDAIRTHFKGGPKAFA